MRALSFILIIGGIVVVASLVAGANAPAQPDYTLQNLTTAMLMKYPPDQAGQVAANVIQAAKTFHDNNPDVSLTDAEVTAAILAGLPEYRARQVFN